MTRTRESTPGECLVNPDAFYDGATSRMVVEARASRRRHVRTADDESPTRRQQQNRGGTRSFRHQRTGSTFPNLAITDGRRARLSPREQRIYQPQTPQELLMS